MRLATLKLSLTETDAYRRLVTFLEEVDTYADEQCDVALQEITHACRDDLAQLRGMD